MSCTEENLQKTIQKVHVINVVQNLSSCLLASLQGKKTNLECLRKWWRSSYGPNWDEQMGSWRKLHN